MSSLETIRRAELVCFDNDGTLFASHEVANPAIQRSFVAFCRERGFDLPAPSDERICALTGKPGQTATVRWADRQPNTAYEWYATVGDGTTTTTGPIRRFTTGAGGPVPTVLAADGFGRTVGNG